MNRTVKTNYPVAFDSPDHINPWGTKKDLSRQLRFENKLYQYMEYKKFNKIMDLGCAGGAFISSMNDLGFLLLGLREVIFLKRTKEGLGPIYLILFYLHATLLNPSTFAPMKMRKNNYLI